jgi:hypothetical protein
MVHNAMQLYAQMPILSMIIYIIDQPPSAALGKKFVVPVFSHCLLSSSIEKSSSDTFFGSKSGIGRKEKKRRRNSSP